MSYISEIQTSFECLQKNVDNKVSVEECVRGGQLIGIQMTIKEALKLISKINTDGKIIWRKDIMHSCNDGSFINVLKAVENIKSIYGINNTIPLFILKGRWHHLTCHIIYLPVPSK